MAQPPSSIPPEVIAMASRFVAAARAGQMDIFQQALPAGLSPGLRNERGDNFVWPHKCESD